MILGIYHLLLGGIQAFHCLKSDPASSAEKKKPTHIGSGCQLKKLTGRVMNNPWEGHALSTRWIKAENIALAETRDCIS